MKASLSKTLLLSTLAYASLILQASELETPQQTEKKSNMERGWRFGEFDDKNSTTKKDDKRTIKQLLVGILDMEEKQLKVQKDILEAIKEIRNPKPKTIIGDDGKPCIANSSAECYETLLEPEAIRYPVIGAYVKNPTVENAARYLKWYSKHTNKALDAGFALYLANTKYGDKAAPMNLKRGGFNDAYGAEKKTIRVHRNKMINGELSKEFDLYIFLGRDFNMDAYAMTILSSFIKDIPNVNYSVVFYNADVKKKLTAFGDEFERMKIIIDGAKKTYIGSNYFKQFGVYATPSIAVHLKKDNSTQLLVVGVLGSNAIQQKITNYLKFKKIIKPNNSVDYKVWGDSTYVKDKFYDIYGVTPDVSKYDYKNHSMQPRTPKK